MGWSFHRRAQSVSRTIGEPVTPVAESRWLPQCSSSLGDVQARMHRAHEHLELLHSEIDEFFARKPYELVVETNAKHTEIYAVVKERERVPVAWSTLVGEIVHNLSAALDHVVSQLVVRRTGLPPSTPATRFPIFLTADDFRSNRGDKVWLRGVGSGGRAIIKAAQPFETGEGAASPLWHLHELAKWDTRRAIPLVAATRRSAEVEAVTGETWRRGSAFEGPLEHDKVLGTVPVTPGSVLLNEHIAKLKMETKLTFHVTIQEPASLGRPQVADALNGIGARVAQILERIDQDCF